MVYRDTTRKINDLRRLLGRLEENRHAYNRVSFAQLRRILQRRIAIHVAELRRKSGPAGNRHAA